MVKAVKFSNMQYSNAKNQSFFFFPQKHNLKIIVSCTFLPFE